MEYHVHTAERERSKIQIMEKPNILFYFSDQQRADTLGCYGQKLNISPHLDRLAQEGVLFENAFTAQPVCGPCRALFQTGRYPTEINCYRNAQPLPANVKTVADYMDEAGYETAYVGKWHLASYRDTYGTPANPDYERNPIPLAQRGGYRGFWRVSDVLEATSHGYDGYIFDENMQKREFKGYRTDCITDFALEYLEQYNGEKPFFLTISHIEPHHQNDRGCYEGPDGSKQRFAEYELPEDLKALGGDAKEMYPDYLGCCKSLDDNLGRIIDMLKKKGLYENTILIYSSDHGSHFKTRNRDEHLMGGDDYKRSCHDSCLKVPLVIAGPGFRGGKKVSELVSTASLPKTFLAMAGTDVGGRMIGENLKHVADGHTDGRINRIFAQISESRTGRCIRTEDYLYSVYAPGLDGWQEGSSDYYEEDFLYDLKKDPYQLENLVRDPAYAEIRHALSLQLLEEIEKAEGERPTIAPVSDS